DSGLVNVVLQVNPKKAADIPSVPNAIDYAKTNEARQLIESGVHAPSAVLRAYALPPGTPKARVNLLRRSFMDTMKDAELATEITLDELRPMAARAGLKLSEEELQKLLSGVNRSRKQVTDLREFMTDTLEPAGIFSASPRNKS